MLYCVVNAKFNDQTMNKSESISYPYGLIIRHYLLTRHLTLLLLL